MQLFPGVFLVANTAYGAGQNLYLLDTGAGDYVMVDAGADRPEGISVVEKVCAVWGIDMRRIRHLLLTHCHYDHTCFAADIQALGAEVVAHRAAVEPLFTGDDRAASFFFHLPLKTLKVDRAIDDGEILDLGRLRIACVGTPGHSACSTVYDVQCEGRHLLFVGDVIALGPGPTAELGWKGDETYDPDLYIASLKKMRALKCDALMPGHGFPVLVGGGKYVDDAYGLAMTTLR
jgi:glyoxylase-like metal-dependent hydrolase (beta-lactamase superfamily II)